MNKALGRPRKNVDSKRVIELASKGLVVNEIAAMENVSHDTLERRFAEELQKGRQLCNASLRRKQYELAMAGNPVMLVWLGKNRLDQADKQEIDVRKQTTVRMVVALQPAELNNLTNGYFDPNNANSLNDQNSPKLLGNSHREASETNEIGGGQHESS